MRNFAKLSGAVVLGIWQSAMMIFPFSAAMAEEAGSEAKGG